MSAQNAPIEPRHVAELVEEYVSCELADARNYTNREPLDDSGIYRLHRLAAEIYARGFADGQATMRVLANGERQRRLDNAGQGEQDTGGAR